MNVSLQRARTAIFTAGGLLLACSGTVRGEIIHHPIQGDPPLISYFPPNPRQDIDIDGDGLFDFVLLAEGLGSSLSAPGRSEVFGRDYPPTTGDIGSKVIPLTLGEEIGPSLVPRHGALSGFYSDASQNGPHTLAGMYVLGAPPDQIPIIVGEFVLIRAYAGVRFEIAGAMHYGWIDMENAFLGGGAGFKVYGWAYETEPNTPIAAGAVPEPASAVILMLGGFMLLSARRGRAQQEKG